MRIRRSNLFTTIRTEGGLLPADFLLRISEGDHTIPGLTPSDYHLLENEALSEAINRSWSRLFQAWKTFSAHMKNSGNDDQAINPFQGHAYTRERWLLPLFQELGFGRLTPTKAVEIEGKSYPISHIWNHVPIHLLGVGTSLDKRSPGVAGAARQSPHSLVQEFLNRSDDHLWAFLSNGLKLRILRDNVSLTRQAYVEFDLETMFEAEVYSDFALLWLLCHESRVEGEPPESCWLEQWMQLAQKQGTRALDHLSEGVEQAINSLGTGFISYKGNRLLRQRLKDGLLSTKEFYRQVLRLVYRLIFLFAAEDRELLLDPLAPDKAKRIYLEYYSTRRLRRLSERHRGSRHVDLGRQLFLIFEKLGSDSGCPELALPALGSFLWSREAVKDLVGCDIENRYLLEAVRHLSFTQDGAVRRPVDYKNLGAEELGSIYESLLEFHPDLNLDSGTFRLTVAPGHERKSTGSYYTPSALIKSLLDTALDPVIEARLSDVKSGDAEKKDGSAMEEALLSIKVCDPACGNGHFLIAAAHRIAKRLASVRTGDEEPGPDDIRRALRDVIGRCLYGVDVNPMAVELCKVNLWLEALVPGRPLSFLDHHIKCGNSLVGTTPALIKSGIPNDAFKALTGDDRNLCTRLRRENRAARNGVQTLWDSSTGMPWGSIHKELAKDLSCLSTTKEETIQAVHEKAAYYGRLVTSETFQKERLVADAWCAAFFWRKRLDGYPPPPYPITHETFVRLRKNPETVSEKTRAEIERLAEKYQFFHWHLEFPEVFTLPEGEAEPENPITGMNGGFDVVLGNPPWERIKLQEKEFFASRSKEIATARNSAARTRLIKSLKENDPALYHEFLEAKRDSEALSHFLRASGAYPLCGRGDINTYAVFAELKRRLMGPYGSVGCIVPSGIATDDTTKFFFQSLMEQKQLASLFDFENRKKIFQAVDSRMKFCLLTMTGKKRPAKAGAEFAFFLHDPAELSHKERRFVLTAEDIGVINPNTKTCPIFRTRQDAELTKAIYRRVPVLIKEGEPEENPWGVSFMAMFHMSNDSRLFRTREELEDMGFKLKGNVFYMVSRAGNGDEARPEATYLPLYEAKMVHHFNHRFGDYRDLPPGSKSTQLPQVPVERLKDPYYAPLPRYWVAKKEVDKRLKDRWDKGWLLGWRDITNNTNERTVIAGIVPKVGVGDKFLLIFSTIKLLPILLSNLSSFSLDFFARQKLGGTSLKYFTMKQLPVLPPSTYSEPCPWNPEETLASWILPRVLELTYTAWDLKPFAEDCGYDGPPFKWNEDRRFMLRCELDAAFFHLYLGSKEKWQDTGSRELLKFFPTPRDVVSYIMDTFPIVKRKDEERHGSYYTKESITRIYDLMAKAIESEGARQFTTLLDPPPADPVCSHLFTCSKE